MSFRMVASAIARAERRRSQILEASYRVFADKGFADATIADIASELGIGHGTFYRYFDNKHAIFEGVIQEVVTRISGALAGEHPADTDCLEDYRDQVRRIAENLLQLLDDDPRAGKLLFVEAMGVSERLDRMIDQLFALLGQLTEAYLINGRDKGFLRPDLDTATTALAINAMILEGGRRVVRAETSGDAALTRARWIDGVVALMFDGIRR